MEKRVSFKFSTEELRKINLLLPRGYKFVTKDDLERKDAQKALKRKVAPPLPPPEVITPPPPPPPKPKPDRVQKVKQQEYEPKRKYLPPTPPPLPPNLLLQGASGTSQKLLQKLRKHNAFSMLYRVSKVKESDLSLSEIENKVVAGGQSYRIVDLEIDIQQFCMMIYKHFQKTAPEYREAAELENYLATLIKMEKSVEVKKIDLSLGLQRNSSVASSNSLRRRPQPIKGSVYQPFTENRAPTPSQKRLLGQMIKKLATQSLQQVCYIVFESTQNKEYIFDLDTLHVKKFRELQEYVKKSMEKTGEWEQRNFEDQEFSNQSEFVIDDDND